MLNSDLATNDANNDNSQEAVNAILKTGAKGALALAGTSTAIVVAIWFAFYLLVFVPRAGAP
jgi:hypothetical protein